MASNAPDSNQPARAKSSRRDLLVAAVLAVAGAVVGFSLGFTLAGLGVGVVAGLVVYLAYSVLSRKFGHDDRPVPSRVRAWLRDEWLAWHGPTYTPWRELALGAAATCLVAAAAAWAQGHFAALAGGPSVDGLAEVAATLLLVPVLAATALAPVLRERRGAAYAEALLKGRPLWTGIGAPIGLAFLVGVAVAGASSDASLEGVLVAGGLLALAGAVPVFIGWAGRWNHYAWAALGASALGFAMVAPTFSLGGWGTTAALITAFGLIAYAVVRTCSFATSYQGDDILRLADSCFLAAERLPALAVLASLVKLGCDVLADGVRATASDEGMRAACARVAAKRVSLALRLSAASDRPREPAGRLARELTGRLGGLMGDMASGASGPETSAQIMSYALDCAMDASRRSEGAFVPMSVDAFVQWSVASTWRELAATHPRRPLQVWEKFAASYTPEAIGLSALSGDSRVAGACVRVLSDAMAEVLPAWWDELWAGRITFRGGPVSGGRDAPRPQRSGVEPRMGAWSYAGGWPRGPRDTVGPPAQLGRSFAGALNLCVARGEGAPAAPTLMGMACDAMYGSLRESWIGWMSEPWPFWHSQAIGSVLIALAENLMHAVPDKDRAGFVRAVPRWIAKAAQGGPGRAKPGATALTIAEWLLRHQAEADSFTWPLDEEASPWLPWSPVYTFAIVGSLLRLRGWPLDGFRGSAPMFGDAAESLYRPGEGNAATLRARRKAVDFVRQKVTDQVSAARRVNKTEWSHIRDEDVPAAVAEVMSLL